MEHEPINWMNIIVPSVFTLLILGGFAFIQRRNTILQEKNNDKSRESNKVIVDAAVGTMTKSMDALCDKMSVLSDSIDKERDERVKNQRDISSMQSDIKTCFNGVSRVEERLDVHISSHK